MQTKLSSIAVTAVALLLGACGGGDGSSGGGGGAAGGGGGGSGGGGTSGSLTLSTASLNFNATNPVTTPAAQTVGATITSAPSGSTVYLRIEIIGSPTFDVGDFQITSQTTGTATITPRAATAVGMGTHTATIRVTACTSGIACTSDVLGTPQSIAVTYNVTGIATSAPAASITVSDNTPAGANATTVTLLSSGAWTASSNLPQLTIAPASGSATSTPVTLTLSNAAIDQMQLLSGTHQATVTFTSGTAQFALAVTINIQKPQILLAAPRVVPAGEAGQVRLRGSLLNLYPLGQVRFGATPANSFAVDQPYMIRAGVPPLTAGTYVISFTDASGNVIPRSTASLVVVNTLGAAAQALPYPDSRSRRISDLIFDAENSALVMGEQDSLNGEVAARVLRYVYSAGNWLAPGVQRVPNLASLALRPDGQGWMATATANNGSDNIIVLCTPDLSTCHTALSAPSNINRWTSIAIGNNNQPLVAELTDPQRTNRGANLLRFSFVTNTMQTVATDTHDYGVLAASADGETVTLGSHIVYVNAARQWRRLASGGDVLLDPMGPTVDVRYLSVDGQGSRALYNNRFVLDQFTGTDLGFLPATTLCGILNRAGNRAYTFDSDGMVHTFNLSAPPLNGAYQEIGSPITLAGDPGAGLNGASMRMAISPDGKTLFLAGDTQVVVQPLP